MEEKIRSAYDKAVKIIQSCENLDHLLVAKKYVNNFFVAFSVPYKGRKVVVSTDRVRIMYSNLLKIINLKQKELAA
jgi:hypothetical protein